MRLLTHFVGLLVLLLCVSAFTKPAKPPRECGRNFYETDPNKYSKIIIKALDEMPPEKIQKKIDTFENLDAYIKRFDRKLLSAVVFRVPNLDYNLFHLQLPTLALIKRKVDKEIRMYMYGAAPRTMAKLDRYLKYGEKFDDNAGRDDQYGKKMFPDSQQPFEEKSPHEFSEIEWYKEPFFERQQEHLPWCQPPFVEVVVEQSPIQCPYEDGSLLVEEKPPYEFDEKESEEHQDFPKWQDEPFSQEHSHELPPSWFEGPSGRSFEPGQPPFGVARPSPNQYHYSDYHFPYEGQPQYGSNEKEAELHQDFPKWQVESFSHEHPPGWFEIPSGRRFEPG